ncbi:hypothetical protein AGMMS50222_10410 [Endomicrobiia bacterium]|nr:hypothetical protein AGMMS50222_10410 [Endomicrobiia bacterium]
MAGRALTRASRSVRFRVEVGVVVEVGVGFEVGAVVIAEAETGFEVEVVVGVKLLSLSFIVFL